MNRDNYITVQGWMISELELKGNDLLVYACIYGFSQAPGQWFSGSLAYLAKWTSSTKRGVQKNLKRLIERGLIEKNESMSDGVRICSYRANRAASEDAVLPKEEKVSIDNVAPIVDYLNKKLGTKYSANSKQTQRLINGRFKEIKKLTVEDFYSVIDDRFARWGKDKKMSEYLRPETLFGSKFESYLEAARSGKTTSEQLGGSYL